MKKLLILLFATVLLSFPVWGATKIGDLYYTLNESFMTAKVTYESFDSDNYKNLSGALSIPETVVFSGKTYSVTSIDSGAFSDCTGLTSIEIPNSIISIGSFAFSGCTGLTNVTIPNSITSIGSFAFDNCSGLTSVIIGNSVTSIGESAFLGCSSLKNINVDNGNPAYASVEGVLYTKDLDTLLSFPGGLQGEFEIPNFVTSIGMSAFSGCKGLTSVTIPNSVTSIGMSAFSGCNALTSVIIGNSVTSIEKGAFLGCTSLTSINVDNQNAVYASVEGVLYTKELDTLLCFPGGLQGAFEIPDSVMEIGAYAFYGCEGLTNVTIPNSVTSIGIFAFSGCYGMTSVIIPDSVIEIGARAFQICNGLTSLFIGKKVIEIGEYAFDRCERLEEVACSCENPPTGKENSFSATTYREATLFVPGNSLEAYKEKVPWRFFLSIKDISESDVDEISIDSSEGLFDVINLKGQFLKRQASQSDIDALNPGIYIIGGKKVIVR